MRWSVVVPIHNDALYLPYSLPSIYRLHPDEVVLLFDRCRDSSQAIAQSIARRFADSVTHTVEVNHPVAWKSRLAYLRRLGYRLASHDVILVMDADMILDPRIGQLLRQRLSSSTPLLRFGMRVYPVSIRYLVIAIIKRLVQAVYQTYGGVYAFWRDAWLDSEEPGVQHIKRAEDTSLQRAILRHGGQSCFIETDTVHLRHVDDTRARSYLKGRLYWSVAQRGFLSTLLSALLFLRPLVLVGYVHERWG